MPWTNLQKGLVKSYQRYAGMDDVTYRALLHEQTGATSSRDSHLTQFHFDAFMPVLEISAHLAETNGLAIGRRPPKLTDWYHWRQRAPARGKATSREMWKITNADRTGIWDLLMPSLPESQRTHAYLCGIAAHAVGHPVSHLPDLTVAAAGALIAALRDRLRHALSRSAPAAPGAAEPQRSQPPPRPSPSSPAYPSSHPSHPPHSPAPA